MRGVAWIVLIAVTALESEFGVKLRGLWPPLRCLSVFLVWVRVSVLLVARIVVVLVAALSDRERRLLVVLRSVAEPVEVWLSVDTVASSGVLGASLWRDLSALPGFPKFPGFSDRSAVDNEDGGRGSDGAAHEMCSSKKIRT